MCAMYLHVYFRPVFETGISVWDNVTIPPVEKDSRRDNVLILFYREIR